MKLIFNNGTKFLLWFFVLFISANSYGETISCGLKKVTVDGNTITQIIHEDGTVHTGGSISNNWTYDGHSIKHRFIAEAIPCGGEPKSRDEIISELSENFTAKPDLYGMTQQEAELMRDYTANLMRQDSECHLLVDAAKSTSREGMFFIDCNDKSSNTKRYWVSQSDLEQGEVRNATSPVSSSVAVEICNKELKARTNNPATYDPSLILGTTNRAIERTGLNVVEIEFEAANAFGVTGQYVGSCTLEAGTPIEVVIRDR